MAERKSIVVLGSLNMDLVMETPRIPAPGETMHGTAFFSMPGGKGLNQAVACQRLLGDDKEWKTYMIGRVGDDEFREKIISSATSEGIDASQVKPVKGKASGVALILVENKSGQNRIILSSDDANRSFQPEEVDAIAPIIQSAAVLICQLEIPLETVERAFQIAHQAGVTTIFNPAPAQAHIPHSLYHNVDYLIPNETETAILLGGDFRIDDLSSTLDAGLNIMAKGVRKGMIVTMGDQGAVIVKRDGHIKSFPAKSVPKVVDTTGAGDCFVGAFAVGLVKEKLSVEGAVLLALCAASLAIQKKGARDSMPFRKEITRENH